VTRWTNSLSAVRPVLPVELLGAQRPRLCSVPPYASSSGPEAIELCEMAGVHLDPWQRFVLTESLGEDADGKWASPEVYCCLSRQNGKSELLVARILAGLFLLGEKLIIFSSHSFDASLEIYRRLEAVVEDTPELRSKVKTVRGRVGSHSHGVEGIELLNGQRVRFKARMSSSVRGFTADCLLLDEAMILKEETIGSALPALSAIPNSQVWYTGSAVDRLIHEHGVVFSRVRERGLKRDPGLAFFEWSLDPQAVEDNPEIAADPETWAQTNPAFGIRITESSIAMEHRAMAPRAFEVERLGIGYWFSEGETHRVISAQAWDACCDPLSELVGPVAIAIDVTRSRSNACITAAGKRADGLPGVEVIHHLAGTDWVLNDLRSLLERQKVTALVYDPASPAASFASELEKLPVKVIAIKGQQNAQAAGQFFDAVQGGKLRHRGTAELATALAGAAKRPAGDAWVWSRRLSITDVSPLITSTLALWGLMTQRGPGKVWDIAAMIEEAEGAQVRAKPQVTTQGLLDELLRGRNR
jgi:hypothetical protein